MNNNKKLIVQIIKKLVFHKYWRNKSDGRPIYIQEYLYVTFNYKSTLDDFIIDLFDFSLEDIEGIYLKLYINPSFYLTTH